jgi:hypothetical protein
MGGQVVLDSNNLDAIVADAIGAPEPPKEEKVEAKGAETEAVAEADDVEGEDGLTPAQKRELTLKMQSAIGKKHRALKDAEEFAAEQYNERRLAEQRAEQYQREAERLKAQVPEPKKLEEPKRESFKTEQEYQDARVDYRAELRFQEKEAERVKAVEAERQAGIIAMAKERVAKAIALVPDFTEVTQAIDTEVPNHIAGYMQESEMFPELGYHFAQHPEDLRRLASLSPAKGLVELGKIESRLTPFSDLHGKEAGKANGDKPSKPSTETAPEPSKPRIAAPIKPLSAGSTTQVEKPASERTYAEERAYWERTHKAPLSRRQRH